MKTLKVVFALLFLLLPGLVHAQDKATKSLVLTVNSGTVVVAPTSIPNGMVGLAYQTTISASGGIAPYTFTISSGIVPAGLSITPSTGILSGTPTTAGTTTFTVQVADSESPNVSATQSYSVTIVPTLAITTASLPAANIGVAYSSSITATGGITPYTFSITSGALPAGITLNPATGTLSGTPTAAGSFTFVITVTDSASNIVRVLVKTLAVVA